MTALSFWRRYHKPVQALPGRQDKPLASWSGTMERALDLKEKKYRLQGWQEVSFHHHSVRPVMLNLIQHPQERSYQHQTRWLRPKEQKYRLSGLAIKSPSTAITSGLSC